MCEQSVNHYAKFEYKGMKTDGDRAATFTCVNGTVSDFCNQRLQN